MLHSGSLRALAFAFVSMAVSAQATELKVSHYLPPNHTVQKVLEDWGRELDTRSGGKLTLWIYPAGQLGPVQRQFDLARNGQADMAVGLTGATPGRYPMTEMAGLPFVNPAKGSSSAAMSERLSEIGPKYLDPEFRGLRVLWFGVPPETSFFTAKTAVTKAEDVRGLKIRFQGEQHAKVLRQLGAVPLQVPPGEVADGLSKGVIDGALFNYEAAESFGLGTVTKHIMEPAFMSAVLVLVVNPAKYAALSAEERMVLDETTGPAAAAKLGERWDAAERHRRAVMQDAGVVIDTMAPAELARLRETLAPVVREAVQALQKDGKPAEAFLADYTR